MKFMRKVEVARGIWWVEIPEADLRVVCGCPADTVKHLMKRGLILNTEVDGVMMETGPNAILLSDVMIQNGLFSNLAEFPVLQMLYRQGMIIPHHPGNTGVKPKLIGSAEQVQAQMQYIYRGNYGLVTAEEMIEAGASPEAAHEMMRLKRRFAFGHICHPAELLDTCVINGEPVELTGGVTLRRMRRNVFDFRYREESVVVDLNLAPFETYECPYPLGFHQVKREYFAVIHSGEGDGWDINRPAMGSILMHQGKVYLVDAGPNITESLVALGIGISEIEGLFHTHSHDDHFAGLTSLIRADHRLKYYATPLVRASVTKKMSALLSLEESAFADYFEIHDLVEDEWNFIEGLEVRPVPSPHPVETTTFHFRSLWEGGYRSYAHLADICRLKVLSGFVTADDAADGLSQAAYDKVAQDYLTPADVKKIDVGGGMIHGDAYDFRGDNSGKMILAHTSQRVSTAQKAIGSSASFGTVDVMIPSNHDFIWRAAFEFFNQYFPDIPHHQVRILLNNPVQTFNPGSILVKERACNPFIYLVLSGNVEMIPAETDLRAVLSAGALVGELSGLFQIPATETYRAVGFVQVLQLPSSLYEEFVRRNNLFSDISRAAEHREVLMRTWLFGEVISSRTLNVIAQGMAVTSLPAGETIEPRGDGLYLIHRGSVGRFLGEHEVERLEAGQFFGEETAVFATPSLFRLRTLEPTDVFLVPADMVREIPSVRWKLFEASSKRIRGLAAADQTGRILLKWHEEFAVNVQRIDNHHRRLFEIANTVLESVEHGRPAAEVAEALGLMTEYARFHFEEEETLLGRYGYAEADGHAGRHRKLLTQMDEMSARMTSPQPPSEVDMMAFLQEWLVSHILTDDRRYGVFLNAKGVY